LVGIDLEFGGIADEADEGARLATQFGNRPILDKMGSTISEQPVIRCQTLMLAYASGRPLNVLSEEIAEQTAEDWRAYDGMAFAHFEQLKTMLDKKDPSCRD
jgi:hypothetical protein